jgi:Zn finger protein HypA/HybF involved in hydrogenase expression
MLNEMEKLFEEGVNLYEQEKLDEAESKFLEALKIDSSSEEVKYNLALVYLEKKEYGKTNFLISQIKEFDCEEIIDELEKVEFDVGKENSLQNQRITESEYINQQANYYSELLYDEYLPESIKCEFCDAEIVLSETERQNKYYNCPKCKNQSNVREKERALESEFQNKQDAELFEILIESENFRIEFVLAAKREIKRRDLVLQENDEFKSFLKNFI